jgi:hypothetical protein
MTEYVLLNYSVTVLILCVSNNCDQAHSQGGASECNAPPTSLDGPTLNLQNIKHNMLISLLTNAATSMYCLC